MAKSLGQIHTVNYQLGGAAGHSTGDLYLLDLPGQLTEQLQTMVRQGNFFKVVGIDMALTNPVGAAQTQPMSLSGKLRYYAPTRGRCEAYKKAYQAVRTGMKLQGINVRGNRHYDFRVPMGATSNYQNGIDFFNQATIDGVNQLTLDETNPDLASEVFTVYNSNIQPEQTAGVDFATGFGLPGGGTPTDFVLNEGEYYEGSLIRKAELQKEEIPFQVSFGANTTTNTATAFEFMWRPDPALYLAVLTGQFEVLIESVTSDTADILLEIAIHVSGWKSIMGNPDKKRRSRKSSKMTRSSRGRKK